MGKQFGSFGNIQNAGYISGNLNQIADEDEMENVIDEGVEGGGTDDDGEDEYEEYLAEDIPNSNDEEISNDIQPPIPPPTEPKFVFENILKGHF
uniref:Uncharacterized protein n=1 Tax=Panagrolaimus sp. PS1159 TaxID=55785 RepID=A0AC35G5R9_9BILA